MIRKIKKIIFFLSNKFYTSHSNDQKTNRIYITHYFLLLIFFVLLAKTAALQLFPPSKKLLENIANQQYQKSINLASFRGTIFDNRKHPLAISIKTPSLAINPKVFSPTKSQINQLSKVISLSKKKINNLTLKTNYFAWLKRKVSHKTAEQVKNLNIKGIHFLSEPARYYPGGRVAANLLGFVGVDNVGLFGLEKMLNKQLSGTIKNIVRFTDARGNAILTKSSSAQPQQAGLNAILTLDSAIQEIAEEELFLGAKKSEAKKAFAIVANPHTGKILAIANYPTFNPNKADTLRLKNTPNFAVTTQLEPGSVLKPIIIASALEQKTIKEHDLHYCEKTGRYQVDKESFIHDEHPKAFMTTAEVIIHSSNICSYKIAQSLNKETVYNSIKAFGFCSNKKIIGLPGEKTGQLSNWNNWKPIRFANISFGQGLFVTGLEVIQAFSVFANGGYITKPHVIERIESSSEEIVQEPSIIQKKRLISQHTASTMKKMLQNVVLEGTGKNAALTNYTAAGKTGTAEKFDLNQKQYSKTKRIASFVGFAPVNNPHLIAYIVIDEPNKKPYYGSKWAAPVFKKIMERSLKYLNISPNSAKLSNANNTPNNHSTKKTKL